MQSHEDRVIGSSGHRLTRLPSMLRWTDDPISRWPDSFTIQPMKQLFLAGLIVSISWVTMFGQAGRRAAPPPKKTEDCTIREPIHGDLTAAVAKFKLVSTPFSVVGVSQPEQKMVYKLVEA